MLNFQGVWRFGQKHPGKSMTSDRKRSSFFLAHFCWADFQKQKMSVSSREGHFWGWTSPKSSFFGRICLGGYVQLTILSILLFFYIHRENSGTLALSIPKQPFKRGLGPNKYQQKIRCIWGWWLRVPSQGYHHFPYPKNHGISKLVVWRSQTPAKNTSKTLFFAESSDS